MNLEMLNRRIDALLDDPLVCLMIRADGVDRAGLARQLGALGRSFEKRRIRAKRPRRLWQRTSLVLCGACAP